MNPPAARKQPREMAKKTNHPTKQVEFKSDLAVLTLLSFALALIIYAWPTSPLRIALGLLHTFLFPGYSLVAALYPHRDDLDTTERIALSLGLSTAIVPLIGLLLNYTYWGITLEHTLITEISFILLCSGIAYYRRSRLPAESSFAICINLDIINWNNTGLLHQFTSLMLVLSITAAVGSLAYAIVRPGAGERFTEFYILGPDNAAMGYPREIVTGDPFTLTIGIVNHERSDTQYRIERSDGGGIELIGQIWLSHEQTWEQPYTLTLSEPGENRKVSFLLYKGDDEEPYRSLHLWITVREGHPAP